MSERMQLLIAVRDKRKRYTLSNAMHGASEFAVHLRKAESERQLQGLQ